jgi:cation diffusion facilitator family transporter
MSSKGDTAKVIVIALLANLGIALIKFIGAFVSKSASMLAEAIHSLVDCSNQVLLLIGNKKAAKPPSKTHPLGYGRETFFWSFIVAILLFSVGGLFAIYEGAHKLHEPGGELSSPFVGLGILVVSLLMEGVSFRACLKEVSTQNTHGSLWKWFHKTTSSELLVVFTEDAAAMLGLTIATTCVLLSWLTGNAMWDALGSILVGAVLVLVAVLLATEIKSLIVGEAASTDYSPFIEDRLKSLIPGGRLLKLIAIQTGGSEVMLSYKVHPGQVQEVDRLINAINELEREIKAKFPEVRWQFVEPDFHE